MSVRTHPILALVAVTLAVSGCTKIDALPRDDAPAIVTTRPVILAPGDVVEFKFYSAPELNDVQQVRPDGAVSLQLVGEVGVAGERPDALRQQLETLYAEHLRDPTITVILRESLGRRVLVGGEVRNPGPIAMPADMDVMEAIILAGGYVPETSAVGHVIVMRDVGDQRVGYRVDLRDAIRGRATTPFFLAAGDTIHVPRSAIANVNTFVEQYVGGVIPDGLRATRQVGNTTYGIDSSLGN
ncbi:MAG: polysaccharide biosynthesis/export family protein [Planctomycetota bacterium]